jgi:hypothetical protein
VLRPPRELERHGRRQGGRELEHEWRAAAALSVRRSDEAARGEGALAGGSVVGEEELTRQAAREPWQAAAPFC